MATPNYGYEKRQRELAKKKKKEDKLRAKAASKLQGDADHGSAEAADQQDDGPENDPAGTPGDNS